MSKYYDILANISSLNDSVMPEGKIKTKKNINIWEKTLYELFLCIIKSERKCEKIRNSLIRKKELMPSQLFCRIDLNRKGYIDAHDLRKFLNDNSVTCKVNSLKNLIKFYTRNPSNLFYIENPSLEYDDFLDYILPKEESDTKNIYLIGDYHYRKKNLRKIETYEFYIDYEVELALVKLLDTEILFFEEMDQLIDKLLRYKDFKVSYIADLLDNNYKDYINELDFYEYLLEKSKIFNENQLNSENIEKIHDDAKLIITHLAKFDTEKIKVFIEDIRLFFNIHNHPEIKIIGRNILSKPNEIKGKNRCEFIEEDKQGGSTKRDGTKNAERADFISDCKNSHRLKPKESDRDLSQTIDSDYLNNRKNELQYNVFHNSYYEKESQCERSKPNRETNFKNIPQNQNDIRRKLNGREKDGYENKRSTNSTSRANINKFDSKTDDRFSFDNSSEMPLKTENDMDNEFGSRRKINPILITEFSSEESKIRKKSNLSIDNYSRVGLNDNTSNLNDRSFNKNNFQNKQHEENIYKGKFNPKVNRDLYETYNHNILDESSEFKKPNPKRGSSYDINKNLKEKRILPEKQMTLPKFFKLILEELKDLEILRLDLSRNHEIVLIELFKLFDMGETGMIDKTNFFKTLRKFGLTLTEKEIDLIYRQYDSDLDGCFDFFEFSELFLPKSPKEAKIMSNRVTSRIDQISNDTKLLLIEFFGKLADSELKIQKFREDFYKEYELSPYEQFMKLKLAQKDFSDKIQMANYLSNYDLIRSPIEIDLIFERFDKNKDGKFYFSEFLNEISIE